MPENRTDSIVPGKLTGFFQLFPNISEKNNPLLQSDMLQRALRTKPGNSGTDLSEDTFELV